MDQNKKGFRASISIEYSEAEQMVAQRIFAHKAQAREAEKELQKLLADREDVKVAKKLVKHADKVEFECNETTALANFMIADREALPGQHQRQPYQYRMEGSTINTLLSGKLLSQEEKRGLLIAEYPKLADIIQPEPAEVANAEAHGLDDLKGPIEVGDLLIWCPDKPKARLPIQVTRIVQIEGDETRIWTVDLSQPGKEAVWNEESRVREACRFMTDKEKSNWRAVMATRQREAQK